MAEVLCKNCGAKLPEGTKVCNRCGKQIGINVPIKRFNQSDVANNKLYAILAYFGILFFIPLLACPNSKYGRFHANQGMLLLITAIFLNIAKAILNTIIGAVCRTTYYGQVYTSAFGLTLISFLNIAVWSSIALMFIIGIINVNTGLIKVLPIIGKYKIIK